MQRIYWDGNISPFLEKAVFDGSTTGKDLARESAADGRREAEGFVDAGAEIRAGC